MSIINKVGLEAEFFLRDAKGNLVYPADHGFDCDSFPIIGEFRGKPGKTRQAAIANLLKAWYEVVFRAKEEKLTIDLKGWTTMTPVAYAEALRKMEKKEVAQCQNIHGTDILERTDDKVARGKITEKVVSAGLHVHFSSQEVVTGAKVSQYDLDQLMKGDDTKLSTYTRLSADIKDGKEIGAASRICKPVVKTLITSMDALLPTYVKGLPPLKYRLPGFYEIKPYGVEYRSLPFNQLAFDHIADIADQAFGLLEAL